MKILIITGSLFPELGHNANLMLKLLPFMKAENNVSILTYVSEDVFEQHLPETFHGVPVFTAHRSNSFKHRYLLPLKAKVFDRGGYSDLFSGSILAEEADRLQRKHGFDAVFASTEPFIAMYAVAMMRSPVRKYLYMMDPPEKLWGHPGTPLRNRSLKKLLARFNTVFTTKYAHEALIEQGYGELSCRYVELGFPMIEKHFWEPLPENIKMSSDKINLLFCGTMSKSLQRAPDYYLELASRLDSRFRLVFAGKYCEDIEKEFAFHSEAEVVALPPVPYSTALSLMHNTDILINIGNRVRVHLPSKIIEYISMCKPIVNFYKFDTCPSLDYTSRYPLCLDINEQDPLTEETIRSFIEFCISSKGKDLDINWVIREFAECTPEHIANTILAQMAVQ